MSLSHATIFGKAGGGAMALPYVAGMQVKFGEVVRSRINNLTYSRISTSPETMTVNADPLDLPDHFLLEDNSTQIGTIQTFPDVLTGAEALYKRHGQLWVRTGSYVGIAGLARPVPKELTVWCDSWSTQIINSTLGLPATVVHMVGDDTGMNWLCVGSNGVISRSTNGGVTWSNVAMTTTASAKLATNGKGRWWLCNNVGEIYVTDNHGDSWVKQQTGSANAAVIFKYVNGKLWYSSGSSVAIGGTTGNVIMFLTLPDTNSTSTGWSGVAFNTNQGTAPYGSNTTTSILDITGNGTDTIWCVGVMSTSYISIMVYNTTTQTWYLSQVGAGTRIQGIYYDDITGYAWVSWAYWYGTANACNAYETLITTTGGTSTNTNPFQAAKVWNSAANVGQGAFYFRRGGSAIVNYRDGTGSLQIFYKQGGPSTTTGRAPAVTGGITGTTTWAGIAHGGARSIVYGQYISFSLPVFGIPGNRSVAAGFTDYIRAQ